MIRHAPYLRGHGVDVLIEILNTIAKLGFGAEVSSLLQKIASSYVPVPMKTDLEQQTISSVDGDESSMVTSELGVGTYAEKLSSNMEFFLPYCISNATCLLENILHNIDTWVFIEKKGIEAMLQLFYLCLLPFLFQGG